MGISGACAWDDFEWPPLSGCGTQHPLRALGGTRVLLAAAPTTPPCFRHWRRSSSLHSGHIQRKNYFKFRVWSDRVCAAMKAPVGLLSGRAVCVKQMEGLCPDKLCGALQTHFHGRGRGGKRQVQRRFLRKRGAAGERARPLRRSRASSPKGRAKP